MATILIAGLGATKPSTRLRILPLVAYLRQRGHEVTHLDVPRSTAGRVGLLRTAAKHDVVLLQKKLFPVPLVRLLARANPNLIFDVDDAIMFHEMERGEPVDGKFFRRFAAIAAASRIVVVGNAYLADFARAARPGDDDATTILTTPIDTVRLTAKTDGTPHTGVVAGWIGTKGNLHQLSTIAPALRYVAATVPGFRLRIIADGSIEIDGLAVETQRWRANEEVAALHGFDIGLMPLEDNLWNRGKGGYKLLQYMAACLPAIASPVGINVDIVRHGENGFLAQSLSDWQESLLKLAGDAELRRRLGVAARRTIESEYALSGYLERYAALIEGCLT